MDHEPGHVPEAYIEVEVRDRDGNIIYYHRQKARTWVRNFFHILWYGFKNTDPTVYKQDGSTAATSQYFITVMTLMAGAGNANYGILVGMGTKAWSFDDYKLDNKIAHGSGPNQLQYGSVTVEDIVVGSNIVYFRIVRTFTNSSTSSVTVTEVALATYYYGLCPVIARDLLSPSVTVPPGSTLTVRYIISMSW